MFILVWVKLDGQFAASWGPLLLVAHNGSGSREKVMKTPPPCFRCAPGLHKSAPKRARVWLLSGTTIRLPTGHARELFIYCKQLLFF